MADFTLVIGNKNYSSWSLRGWLMARIAGIEFEELVIPLDLPETQPEIRKHSPSPPPQPTWAQPSTPPPWPSASI